MKLADIQKLVDAGYLSPEQQQQVIAQFDLREESSRFLAIISTIGAVMVGAGLILLLAANWEEIPRLLKIIVGVGLMVGAQGLGLYLRSEAGGAYTKTGEALHLLGSGLFLANIALLGQIYHLSGQATDAILLWCLGIASLPWLLRSRPQYVLLLIAAGVWLFMKAMEQGSLISVGENEWLLLWCAQIGLIYFAIGYFFFHTSFESFASPTQKLGLLAFHLCSFPMTWGFGFGGGSADRAIVLMAQFVAGVLLLVAGAQREKRLSLQWRMAWPIAFALAAASLLGALFVSPVVAYSDESYYHWIISAVLFIFCLVQINVALQIQSLYMLNLAVVFVAGHIVVVYLVLFGSMAFTGFMFIISGIFLLTFGVYLEKKRRRLVKQLKTATVAGHV